MEDVEHMFGDPEIDCPIYVKDTKLSQCKTPNSKGFCDKCPYNNPDFTIMLKLRDMGALDDHFNPIGKWFDELREDKQNI